MSRPYRRNITRLRRTQGCLTDCVAYYFNTHPEKVPFFVYPRSGWSQRVRRYFARRGFRARWQKTTTIPQRGTHLVCGDSLIWKTAAHVVVYRNGTLAYDPDFPSRWTDTRMTHRLVVTRR